MVDAHLGIAHDAILRFDGLHSQGPFLRQAQVSKPLDEHYMVVSQAPIAHLSLLTCLEGWFTLISLSPSPFSSRFSLVFIKRCVDLGCAGAWSSNSLYDIPRDVRGIPAK